MNRQRILTSAETTDQVLSFSLSNVSIRDLTDQADNPIYPFMFEFERNASVSVRYGCSGCERYV